MVLFIFAIFPTIINEDFREYEVTGEVLEEVLLSSGEVEFRPIPQALVEIGGFRTRTDNAGNFTLQFRARERRQIPIVVQTQYGDTVERLSFAVGVYEMEKNITVRSP